MTTLEILEQYYKACADQTNRHKTTRAERTTEQYLTQRSKANRRRTYGKQGHDNPKERIYRKPNTVGSRLCRLNEQIHY